MSETKLFIFGNKRNALSYYTITILIHNVRSRSKHIDDKVMDGKVMNNDIIGFTATSGNLSGSTCKIMKRLIFLNLKFNNNGN